jgi:hypothetical protein
MNMSHISISISIFLIQASMHFPNFHLTHSLTQSYPIPYISNTLRSVQHDMQQEYLVQW